MKRRGFMALLSGTALTAPAHQWLVHEPEPLVAGLSGHRVSAELADRFPVMIAELRTMDDVGGGNVLSLAQHEFGWVAGLLDRASYDEPTRPQAPPRARRARAGLAGWGAYDSGQPELAQRFYMAALRAAHTVNDRPLGAYTLGHMAYQATRRGQPAWR